MPESKPKLSHFSDAGAAHMVDIGTKPASKRKAIAQGRILMRATTLEIIKSGQAQKGDVLGIARIAAIMACKRTADLIPLCHPLALSHASVEFSIETKTPAVYCQMCVETTGPTGVEMEALTGVQIALLTIYDMCKAVDKGMVISDVALLEKYGGKSGDWIAQKSESKT